MTWPQSRYKRKRNILLLDRITNHAAYDYFIGPTAMRRIIFSTSQHLLFDNIIFVHNYNDRASSQSILPIKSKFSRCQPLEIILIPLCFQHF